MSLFMPPTCWKKLIINEYHKLPLVSAPPLRLIGPLGYKPPLISAPQFISPFISPYKVVQTQGLSASLPYFLT